MKFLVAWLGKVYFHLRSTTAVLNWARQPFKGNRPKNWNLSFPSVQLFTLLTGSHVAQTQAHWKQKSYSYDPVSLWIFRFPTYPAFMHGRRRCKRPKTQTWRWNEASRQMSLNWKPTMRFSPISNISIFQGQFDPKWKHISSNKCDWKTENSPSTVLDWCCCCFILKSILCQRDLIQPVTQSSLLTLKRTNGNNMYHNKKSFKADMMITCPTAACFLCIGQ